MLVGSDWALFVFPVWVLYLKHLMEAADKAGTVPNVPDRLEIGYRAQNALIAHDDDVVIPARPRNPLRGRARRRDR